MTDLQETELMKKVFKQYRHLPTYPKPCIHYSIFLSANPAELTSKESKIKKK